MPYGAHMKYFLYITLLLSSPFTSNASDKPVIGWIETVSINSTAFQVKAKIDTGADNSSIDASELQLYKKADRQWVKFVVRNNMGDKIELDKPVEDFAYIKRKQGGVIERPVVLIDICIGNTSHRAPVNLASRGHFNYRMLIGRSFLSGHYLVDSSMTESTTPSCQALPQASHDDS